MYQQTADRSVRVSRRMCLSTMTLGLITLVGGVASSSYRTVLATQQTDSFTTSNAYNGPVVPGFSFPASSDVVLYLNPPKPDSEKSILQVNIIKFAD